MGPITPTACDDHTNGCSSTPIENDRLVGRPGSRTTRAESEARPAGTMKSSMTS